MIIVGDKITKIVAQRGDKSKIGTIESKPEIKSVKTKDLFAAGEKKLGLSVEYTYTTSYSKDTNINVEGSLFITGNEDSLKTVEKNYKKTKKLDDNVAVAVLRKIFELGMTNSVLISKTLGLPAPIHLPKVVPKE